MWYKKRGGLAPSPLLKHALDGGDKGADAKHSGENPVPQLSAAEDAPRREDSEHEREAAERKNVTHDNLRGLGK